MLKKAYAKVNLSLDVVGKREDGYHLLNMIMQSIEIYDVIKINKADKDISLICNKKYVPTDERNIAYKAAKLFMEYYDIKGGVAIEIKKNIPVAAGLAGGSTDAATVLSAMGELYKIDMKKDEILSLGLKLGADVPFCSIGGTALCQGIGEIITPLKPFKNHIMVLVKPSFGISTKEVYGNLDINRIKTHPNTDLLLKAIEEEDIYLLGSNMKNVLENVTVKKHKSIAHIKELMLKMGAVGSMMSGSGPSVFGFFDDSFKAQKCYEILKKSYDEVFITRTI